MQRYMGLLDEPGMTDLQKRQVIEALQGIVQYFVDAAWGDDPTQVAIAKRSASPDRSRGR